MTPKIYHLHPLVAGACSGWAAQFARVGKMGFSHVCTAPPFLPGKSGDIFLTADHERLHPALGFDGDADEGLASLSRAAQRHGLRLMCDIALDEIAVDAPIRRREPAWFRPGFDRDLPDPRRPPAQLGATRARFDDGAVDALTAWWCDRLRRLLHAGLGGFRFLHPQRVPGHVWQHIVAELREIAPDCLLLAWTPGADRHALVPLAGAGFDRVCASTAWWDGRASWLLEELNDLADIAPALASPEPSFSDRLASHLPADGDAVAQYRHALRRAATIGDGWLMPMGFEFAAHMPFDPVRATPADFDRARAEAPADLSADVTSANSLVDQMASLNLVGPPRSVTMEPGSATALQWIDATDVRDARRAVVAMINADVSHPAALPVQIAPLPPQSGAAFSDPEPFHAPCTRQALNKPLGPGEVRIVTYTRLQDIVGVAQGAAPDRGAMEATRIAIEAMSPSVPDGDYAVKRVVGEDVTVSADIVADGHEVLAAALLWRPADEPQWQRVPMRLVENDRWQGCFTPARIGPHLVTLEAWWDVWGTYRHDLHAKHAAGQTLALEIEEGRRIIAAALRRATGAPRIALQTVLDRLTATDEAGGIGLLLSDSTLAAMQAVENHPFVTRHAVTRVDVDRPQAMFASWYEMFPRSATDDSARHGTWNDVIRRLPSIRAMGFDVLYFPPIHPIGSVNRKGRNNAVTAQPGDVGSPYAIGGADGGHDAIHPQLGTLDEFRALIVAAREHELEVALDFAVQCAPDHPWLKQHRDWFVWRPDGSMRYAENPPKKYQDIVNPDFYGKAALPALWMALRDVIQFWVDQGVRIFRVDNPHTKPFPFWRWMIADIRDRHPDVLFLAEAFTRPKVMYRLAKLGFNQSYTYFTWRNTKQEITEYLTELNQAPVRDFFRPNFFVNTPDINPVYLQTSGRAGFLIRAALATTLSGLWGMYSGFEICEAAPLPGREEYLDSEKYEIRVRNSALPGNIVPEITALNRIRRAHPALQTHLGLTFYNAFNDQVLLYGKRRPGAPEMILIAVSLDPHTEQIATIEVPLWEFGLPDDGTVHAVDLMRGHRFTWHGKDQQVSLNPAELPFVIWQLSPGVPR